MISVPSGEGREGGRAGGRRAGGREEGAQEEEGQGGELWRAAVVTAAQQNQKQQNKKREMPTSVQAALRVARLEARWRRLGMAWLLEHWRRVKRWLRVRRSLRVRFFNPRKWRSFAWSLLERQRSKVSAQRRAEIEKDLGLGRVEIVEEMEIGRVAIVEDLVIYVALYSASPTGYRREAFPLPCRAG